MFESPLQLLASDRISNQSRLNIFLERAVQQHPNNPDVRRIVEMALKSDSTTIKLRVLCALC